MRTQSAEARDDTRGDIAFAVTGSGRDDPPRMHSRLEKRRMRHLNLVCENSAAAAACTGPMTYTLTFAATQCQTRQPGLA